MNGGLNGSVGGPDVLTDGIGVLTSVSGQNGD